MMEKNIPAMTPRFVHTYLKELGRQWTGQGVGVELGSWLGATAVSLLEGLVEAGYDRPFYCYDRWEANEEQVIKARDQGMRIENKQDLLPLFMSNVGLVYENVKACKGNISGTILDYPGDPVEFCLFDAPKSEPTFSNAIRGMVPYWIPGVTILGLLDYYFYLSKPKKIQERFLPPANFIKEHPHSFVRLKGWSPGDCSCVFFKYVKKIKYNALSK